LPCVSAKLMRLTDSYNLPGTFYITTIINFYKGVFHLKPGQNLVIISLWPVSTKQFFNGLIIYNLFSEIRDKSSQVLTSDGDPCVFSPDLRDPGSLGQGSGGSGFHGSGSHGSSIKTYVNFPHDLCRTYMLYKKRFYKRETNSSVFCAIKLKSL
jgi:hypothetical protein